MTDKIVSDKSDLQWIRIKYWLKQKKFDLRNENENDLDLVQTSRVRGQLELIKEMLDFENDEKVTQVVDTTYIE